MIIIIHIFILILILFVLYKCIFYFKIYEPFKNLNSEYPCRVFLSDNDFLTHMITHHQMAIDISYQHIHNTKNEIIMKLLRELIWTQEYEIGMMLHELNHKTENISEISTNSPFIPSISSVIYPNTYCDPMFFTSTHNMKNEILTDAQYIKHMIPHHQVAIDMCKILLQHTKSDFLIYLSYRMIQAQESEIILLNAL